MDEPDIRICFLGDSFINGTCDPECLGWAGRVCACAMRAGHRVTYYNLGIRRDTSTDVANRWCQEVALRLKEVAPRFKPEFDGRVVFSFGANDVTLENGGQRVDLGTSLENARRIFTEASPRFPCLWIGPPPVADTAHNERLSVLCGEFQALAQELSISYLPVLRPLLRSQAWMSEVREGDGAHPQAVGYSELAQLIQAWPAWWFHREGA